ncbi:GNAT family N-acetyltransferase [Rathayibacter sp. ZW T2_19]|uniref:GNAT family N-acetyltransferase n=1 Tax=Rathayibacter rubneri TaxID=2950106 RepID=A0A9X2E1B6_9MICO|nr:GNAT family N-acetyltransferase [Rathayibacter rubneri]MCM6762679.1 GNAT family N-acetyltransferase [Rathayibacter rubneri]
MTAIRAMLPEDWAAVETIYREGIATGHATFEAEPPTWEAFDAGKLDVGRLAAVEGEQILGWAALSPVSRRPVYRGVVEHSVYVAAAARDRGVGAALVRALIDAADDAGLWTIQSSIFPENTASLALHDRVGFRRVGTRERIALMTHGPASGIWRDTVLVERRRPS